MEMSRFHVRFVVPPVQLILCIRQKLRKLQEQGRLWNKTINHVTGEIAINPQCIFQKDEQLGLHSWWPIPVFVMFWKQGRTFYVCINPAHLSIGQWSHWKCMKMWKRKGTCRSQCILRRWQHLQETMTEAVFLSLCFSVISCTALHRPCCSLWFIKQPLPHIFDFSH